MKITVQIKKLGTSHQILIPSSIMNIGNFKNKEIIEIDMQKLEDLIREYMCSKCGHKFCVQNGDDIYCTACGNEDKKSIGEIIEKCQ